MVPPWARKRSPNHFSESIDPGVPWTYAEGGGEPMLLALKSGNFGAPDFFIKAFTMLEGSAA